MSDAMRSSRVTPVILTCARRLDYVHDFIVSWRGLPGFTPSPVIVLDTTTTLELPFPYIDEIASLEPRVVVVHPRVSGLSEGASVQDAAFTALAEGLKHRREKETHLLFLEDDIVFSSRFDEGLRSCDPSPDLGYTTLYQPWDGYGQAGRVSDDLVRGGHFYGTQCLVMPFASVELLLAHRETIERTYPPGYDLRWSRFLVDQGRPIHTTARSYVQHIGVESRLGCMAHRSNTFVE